MLTLICFHASSLPCLHTFWHAIPTSLYIFYFLFIIAPHVVYTQCTDMHMVMQTRTMLIPVSFQQHMQEPLSKVTGSTFKLEQQRHSAVTSCSSDRQRKAVIAKQTTEGYMHPIDITPCPLPVYMWS